MTEIELVIKIPEEIYQHYKNVWQKRRGSIPESCIAFGKPLPKGHGRLIDAREYENSIRKHYFDNSTVIRCIEIALGNAETIIKADKGE